MVRGKAIYHREECPTLKAASSRRRASWRQKVAAGRHEDLERHAPQAQAYLIIWPFQTEGARACERCKPPAPGEAG